MKPRLLLVPVLLALSATVAATLVVRLDLPGLVARAERIVIGRVVDVRTVADAGGLPATRVTLAVHRALKGLEGVPTTSFLLHGGELAGRGLYVAGMPRLKEGEQVLLFLGATTARGITLPVGLGQGVWRERRDPHNGRPRLVPDLAGLHLVEPSGRAVGAPLAERDAAALLDIVSRLVALQASAEEGR